jgi:hypothetical protein
MVILILILINYLDNDLIINISYAETNDYYGVKKPTD